MKHLISLLLIMYISITPVLGIEIVDTITASDTITGLTMANGRLWVGTSGGILRYSEVLEYSGMYTTRNGLPDNRVIAVATAGSRVFALTRTGFVEYDSASDQFRDVTVSQRIANPEFAGMAISGRNILLVMTDRRIFTGDLTTFPLELKTAMNLEGTFSTLTSDLNGTFWIGTREGTVVEINTEGSVVSKRTFSRPVQSLNIAGNRLYVGTSETLYACSREGVRIQRPVPIEDVISLVADDAGIISISRKGVIRHGRISPFRCATVLLNLRATCIITSWDQLLVGTTTGLYTIPLKSIRYRAKIVPKRLSAPPAMPENCRTAAIFNDTLWVGASNGLFSLPLNPGNSDTTATRYPGILPSSRVRRVCADDETLYIATAKGLVMYDGTAWTVIESTTRLRSSDLPTFVYPSITDICRDPETGGIWISDTGTINRKRNGKWHRFNYLDGLKSSHIQRMSVRGGTCATATTDRGTEILRHNTKKFISIRPGQKIAVTDVAVAENGVLFCLTGSSTLMEIHANGREIKHTLPENITEPICLEYHRGKLWIGTRSGLITGLPGNWELMTTADGISGNKINEISFYREAVILSTSAGITLLSPAGLSGKTDIQ